MARIASASPFVPQIIAVTATCGLLATIAFAKRSTTTDAVIPVVAQESTTEELVDIPVSASAQQPAPPAAPSNQLLFVFRAAGHTYVKLSDDEPAHGKRTLVHDDDGGVITVADVTAQKLPARFRGWETKTLTVDGGCTARVTGFAVITRLIGTPSYAGLDDETWNVSTAASAGSSQLAARIDVPAACAKGLYARDAALAPIVTLEAIDNADLTAQARSAFLASEIAQTAQSAWADAAKGAEGANDAWDDHAELTTHILRHPTTGVTLIGIHAAMREMGCGGPDINLWALFEVGRNGELITVEERKLETLYSVERILDLDNDGKVELIGRDWLGLDQVLTRANGEEISRLGIKFHGCPC